MVNKPDVEDLLKGAENRYELVIAISRRARQLTDGEDSLIDTKENNRVTVASLEFNKEKYSVIRENENKSGE